MSFILVDSITTFESGKFVRGLKHVSASEPYLCHSHSTGDLIYLPSLMGESIGQTAAWSVMHALDFKKRPVAGIVSQVNIFDEVKVGETLMLEAHIDALDEEAVEYHGAAFVGEKKVFEIESAIGPMMAMSEMNPETEVRRQFTELLQLQEKPFTCVPAEPFPKNKESRLSPTPHASFDRLISLESECLR